MAIKWLDAKRLQGTNAERLALTINGGTDATNNGATRVTAPTSQPSNLGTYAWSFDENDPDSVSVPIDLTNHASYTMIFWLHPNHTTTHPDNIWYNGATGSDAIEIQIYNDSAYDMRMSAGSTAVCKIVDVAENTWGMYAFVKDGDTIKAYKNDGVIDGSIGTATGAGSGALTGGATDGSDWYLFRRSSESYDGDCIQFLLYDTALTVGQIQTIYNSGDGQSSPSTTNLLVHYNFQQAVADGLTNQATIYPNLPNGTIFNETDTYKYFMFDGTDTWNQMVSS